MAVGFNAVFIDRCDVLSGPAVLNVAFHANDGLVFMPVVLSDMASVVIAEQPNDLALALQLVYVILQLRRDGHMISALRAEEAPCLFLVMLLEASHAYNVSAGHEDALLLKQVELVIAHVADLRFHLEL